MNAQNFYFKAYQTHMINSSLTYNNVTNYLSFNDAVSVILKEESNHKNKEDRLETSKQVEALSMTERRSIECDFSGSHSQRRLKSQRKNFKCYHCGMRGKKECWHNLKNT